ncbi:MAG TPA: lysophospholipid acyltransferase family protein [Anaerolineaceae bacterium]|nr:lysophospholipid acyltransferase family protein [Anaerolineaceae bacterium]HOG79221.1 lysophospholipid acyltransferase family protein [Anaerolineaceae bacterium]
MLTDKLMYWFSKPLVIAYSDTMLRMNVKRHTDLPHGPKIIAANHPSTTDPFFVAGMLRHQSYILINELLFQVPILGEYLRRSGHIPVEAGNGPAAIDAAVQRLREGKTVIIFPEGDLSPSAQGFHPARTGVARIALLSGAPVIPVGINLNWGLNRTVKSTVRGKVSYGRWYLRGPYQVTVGKPLQFNGDVEDRPHVRKVADRVMHEIIELAHESEMRMNQSPSLPLLPEIQ